MKNIIVFVQLFIAKLFLFPQFLAYILIDYLKWIFRKGWKDFTAWGLHIYVGGFGGGKTSCAVYDTYCKAKKYPQVSVMTNIELNNFPEYTQILPLHTIEDILNAPENTIVLIDEIGTIFNSRDFLNGKKGVPKLLFQKLNQVRKQNLVVYGTTKRWIFVDKQLRDIADTVRHVSCILQHPFSRLQTVKTFDATEYDEWYTNPMLPLTCLSGRAFIQTNALRSKYNTVSLVEGLLTAEYLPDDEILRNQGDSPVTAGEISRAGKRAYKRSGGYRA